MADPTFTAPPTAPSRADPPATFNARADAFIAWFATLYTELQAFVTWTNGAGATLVAAVNAGLASVAALAASSGFSGTSTTSRAVGTGSKAFTTQTGRAFAIGGWVTITDTADAANSMFGQVTTYDSGTGALTVNVTSFTGSGTKSSWAIAGSGPQGISSLTKASAAEIRDGDEDTHYVTAKGLMDAVAVVTASVSGSYTLDLSTGFNFALTLSGNLTFAVPSNLEDGQSGIIWFIQDATGGRTLSLNASIKKPGAAPTLSATANAVNRFGYIVRGSTFELTAMESIA